MEQTKIIDTLETYQCLGKALRRSHNHHRHHAIMLTELSLDPLLDQEFEGRHRAECVLNSEVSYV